MKLDPLECLEKINHTVCLNYNNHTLAFNLDSYKEGPNNGPIDCDSIEEFADCYSAIYDTLAENKQIEEKLGIDLNTLFKALEQGYVWIKTKQGIQKATIGAFSLKNLKVVLSYDMCDGGWRFHRNMHLTDYGKTWALTKEEIK